MATNAAKILEKQKQKKEKAPKAKKIKVDFESYPLAIKNKTFVVPVGGRVYFERTLDGKKLIHEGHVFSVDDKGLVSIWDETKNQFFSFNVNQTVPKICAASELELIPKKIVDSVDMNENDTVGNAVNHEGSNTNKFTL